MTTIRVSNWWGKKSVLVDRDTFLYKLKKRFQKRIAEEHGLVNADRRNEVPHIAVTTDAAPCDEDCRLALHDKHLVEFAAKVHDDLIEIPLGYATKELPTGTHMTLFYQAGVGKTHAEALKKIYLEVLDDLEKTKERPEDSILSDAELQLDRKAKRSAAAAGSKEERGGVKRRRHQELEATVKRIEELTEKILAKLSNNMEM